MREGAEGKDRFAVSVVADILSGEEIQEGGGQAGRHPLYREQHYRILRQNTVEEEEKEGEVEQSGEFPGGEVSDCVAAAVTCDKATAAE